MVRGWAALGAEGVQHSSYQTGRHQLAGCFSVSKCDCSTSVDLYNHQEQLDTRLQQRQARETGICPVRRELYSQCFGQSDVNLMMDFNSFLLLFR